MLTQTLRMVPSVAEDAAAGLIAELAQIDANQHRDRGDAAAE
jgi:hypothetical protein